MASAVASTLPDRPALERRYHVLQQRIHARARDYRATQPGDRDWAYGYAGKPRQFFGELLGNDWWSDDWQAWRAFISSVFCQPLTAAEWWTFRHCTGLSELPQKRPASVWLPVGRRGGKSRTLAAIAVYIACCFDWTQYLAPGELGVLPVLAQDRRSAHTIMSYIKAFLEHPKLQPLVQSDLVESIHLDGQILIEVVTASYKAIRNRTVIAALLDEIAFWSSEDDSANPDSEIINALSPAMATIPNALMLGASSPYARRGVLWEQYDRNYGKPGGPFVWKAPTWVMNPSVPQSFIDEKYADDPLSAAAEYGAEFRSDVDAFITREVLDAALMRDVFELPYSYGTKYAAFVDPSGGSSDSFTLAIAHIDHTGKNAILDLVRERRPPFSPENVVDEFVPILRDYKVTRVRGDNYAGEWPKDRFRKCGIGYEVSKLRRSDIYHEFLPLLNSGHVSLLDERRLYNQFLSLERRVARGGKESIDHPPGGHDDLSNVAAGVFVELLGKRDPTRIDPAVLEMSARIIAPPTPRLGSRGPRW